MFQFLKKRKGPSSFSSSPMASSLSSLSSLFFSRLPNANSNPNCNPNSKPKFQLPFTVLGCSASSDQNQKLAAVSEKKSFAVATGEIFIGLASRLIKARRNVDGSGTVLMFRETEASEVGSVVGGNGVVWEQRVEDVEAERRRNVVTSPGFSFSAAGLLFPYHLGVAKFLIEKGYIKVRIVSCVILCIPFLFVSLEKFLKGFSIFDCQLVSLFLFGRKESYFPEVKVTYFVMVFLFKFS